MIHRIRQTFPAKLSRYMVNLANVTSIWLNLHFSRFKDIIMFICTILEKLLGMAIMLMFVTVINDNVIYYAVESC